MQRYVHAPKHGLDRIAGLSEISGIVLPAQTPAELLQPYRELGIALTLA